MRSFEAILDDLDVSQYKDFNRKNFLIYLKFMMMGGDEPTVETFDYYRYIYKHIEMVWEEEAMIDIRDHPEHYLTFDSLEEMEKYKLNPEQYLIEHPEVQGSLKLRMD